ncbi:glycosyltransferase [Oscillatoria sp. FACHB-1406]|uniref:glycosyltransferase n=1 Tax=Oscillatoria sp. FACHB-1406 TaxID=2692846 RepID=UPI001681FBB5|nr:glycosyltransferase [Oscillatoria sp. FACHB-1406]MBD2577312.1 glycosyltransferase [Oscillatoria sp. FACHB-1406]
MKCKICDSPVQHFSRTLVLEKYEVDYFQCKNCGFVQTEEPYWLEEAYKRPIAKSDYGLVSRNISFARLTASVLANLFNIRAKFLDYGSGYGLLVRLMRDMGIDFWGYDRYCESLFATEMLDEPEIDSFELVTAFEVFEHFVNPLQDIEKILQFSKNILFSTELLPPSNPKPDEWGYYVPHEGQHIAIYTVDALTEIAQKFNLHLYTNQTFIHLLSERDLPQDLHKILDFSRYCSVFQETRSTLWSDIQFNVFGDRTLDKTLEANSKSPKILIDGIFFQYYNTGIARVWQSLLEEWSGSEFSKHILVLDRENSAPKVAGIEYLTIPQHNYGDTDAERALLQQICDEKGATLFVSTYYTTPISTPSVFMAYDMIPEVLGADVENNLMWREKHYGIQHASAYISISQNTARDLLQCFPDINLELVTVAHCGIKAIFTPASPEEIAQFKLKYGITKPYFILVGISSGYKNAQLFFEAFSQLPTRIGFELVSTGNRGWYDEAWRQYTPGNTIFTLQLNDEELRLAYAGAVALVYPSLYEGFGLPVLEALACGCPVITTPNASIPEVAGEAAIYVKEDNIEGMANALCEVQKPSVRQSLIAKGLDRAKQFSWKKMSETVSAALIEATLLPLKLREANFIIFPDWTAAEEELIGEFQRVLKGIAIHPERDRITLLIDTTGIAEEDANLFLSAVAMNLLMEEEIDVSESAELSLVGQLAPLQWEKLRSRLQGRISLKYENKLAIVAAGLEDLQVQLISDDGKE